MQRFTRIIIVCIVVALSLNLSAIAASGVVQPAAETEKSRPVLTYSPSLTKAEVEKFLGRKMTKTERLGFRINKKKFVSITNQVNAMGSSDDTNGMAIAGFVLSLLIAPLGIIFSAIALGQIKRSGQRGRGFAIAGLVIGIVGTVWILVALL